MKTGKIISVILAVVIMASAVSAMIVPAAAVGNDAELVYTALGDSIAAGYALPSYTKDGSTPAEGYVAQFAEFMKADKVNDLAVSGQTSASLLVALNNEIYKKAVSDADVITISIGSNDLLGPGVAMILESVGLSGKNMATIANYLKGKNEEQRLEALKTVSTYLKQPEQVARFEAAVNGFKENWDNIIGKIAELNPDAVVFITGFYNPFMCIRDFSDTDTDLDKTTEKYLNLMGEHIASSISDSKKCFVVDVTEVGDYTNMQLKSSNAVFDPHPNKDGHVIIFKALRQAYDEIPEETTEATEPDTTVPDPVQDTDGTAGDTADGTSAEDTADPSANKSGCTAFGGLMPAAALAVLAIFGIAVLMKKK